MQEPQKLLNRNFMLQWQGQTVSRVGSQLFSAAMVFWIKRATGSASIMGLLSLLSGLPAVLLTPIGGAFADRFSRRKIMIICDLVRGIALLALTALIFLQPKATGLILGGIFAFAILNAAVNSFFGPAISATIPDLVPTNRVTSANSLGQLSMQISVFLGQGLGGVLFRILGAPLLFLVNALSFFYASASEVFVTIPQQIPERRGTVREQFRMFGQEIAEGLRYVRSRPGLRELVVISTVLSFFLAPIVVLLPFYVEDTLRLTTDWYGFILVAFGVGTLLGYILGGVLNLNGSSRARTIIGLTFVNTLAYGMLGVVQTAVPVLFLAVLGGLGSGFVTLNITTLVQVTTPSDIRGRVMGLLATLSAALTPIAAGLAGIIADLVNQNIGLIYGACGVITFAAAAIIATNRAYRGILATDLQQSGLAGNATGAQPVQPADPLERTRDVYEAIPAYPQPPIVPMPKPDDLDEVLAELGQPVGSTARQITDRTFRLTGIRSFMEQLPDRYEELARRHNMRLPGLYAPVISATLALQDDPRGLDPLQRAATLILGVRELQRAVFSGSLPPDTLKGEALEMGQYPSFFSTSQVIDGPLTTVYKSKVFSKVNVIIDGCFYLIDIGEPDAMLSAADLVCTLSELVSRTRQAPRTASPGSLTCTSDATQVRQFNRLRRIEGNAASLDALKHTLFTLCLELDNQPATLAEAARVAHSQNPENRWFHASLQIVVFGNAQACAICNFSTYLDGNVMMRGAAEIQRRAAATPVERSDGSALPFQPVIWNIPPLMLERAKPGPPAGAG